MSKKREERVWGLRREQKSTKIEKHGRVCSCFFFYNFRRIYVVVPVGVVALI